MVADITELKSMWEDLHLVHGNPRHPQSQGSVERLNCDVKDVLVAWMGDHDSTDWPNGLRFVQFQKNCSHHSGINQAPYKALFGTDPKVGLSSSSLPSEVIKQIVTEDDLRNTYCEDDQGTGAAQPMEIQPEREAEDAESNDEQDTNLQGRRPHGNLQL